MSLDDLCPNYSRFQFNSDPIKNFDGQKIPPDYKKYCEPLNFSKNLPETKRIDTITLKVPFKVKEADKENEKKSYTIKKSYIWEEYKKFKVKFFQ